ncbi:MAG TPA: lipid-A-disaccharide synthase [Candidatus Omnitrophota bacterium]|nr:lipid-A-disaccharide synthase [Candidatus Omnitrophota bacterium]
MEKKILIVAGEASGDLHASHLIQHLKNSMPDVKFYGLGGRNMKAAGADIVFDLTSIAVVGFFEILKHYSLFKKIFNDILEKTKVEKPDAAILVDYPGFNLRLAKELKNNGIPVIYFISPQVWAWGKNRISFIRKTINLMLVLFKFEETLYKDGKFNVKFVGHPLLDVVKAPKSKQALLSENGLKEGFETIALLPGSRNREILNHLPIMIEAAQKMLKENAKLQFLICRASSVGREVYKTILDNSKIDFPYKMLDDETYNGISACDVAIVASGTATLETAILNKPMVIIYKVSFITWLLAKMFVKIPNIGLVNVVAGQRIVPELVQKDANPKNLAKTTLALLKNKARQEKIHAELYALKNTLGIPGAYSRAANEIKNFLNNRNR